jgi:hypothetical protein
MCTLSYKVSMYQLTLELMDWGQSERTWDLYFWLLRLNCRVTGVCEVGCHTAMGTALRISGP